MTSMKNDDATNGPEFMEPVLYYAEQAARPASADYADQGERAADARREVLAALQRAEPMQFAEPQPYHGAPGRRRSSSESAQNAGADEAQFLPPVPYFAKQEAPAAPASAVNSNDDDLDGGAAFAEPSNYFASNAMAKVEALTHRVMRLIAEVARAVKGSVKRRDAERNLTLAQGDLRTALRARQPELQSAMESGSAAERAEAARELAAVQRRLAVIDDEQEEERRRQRGGTARTLQSANAEVLESWTNGRGETVERTARGLRVVQRSA
jgi:hypothetical protein